MDNQGLNLLLSNATKGPNMENLWLNYLKNAPQPAGDPLEESIQNRIEKRLQPMLMQDMEKRKSRGLPPMQKGDEDMLRKEIEQQERERMKRDMQMPIDNGVRMLS